MRSIFLSRLVYQTYNGYVMSQFKKMQADIRNQGQVKWKHVMHLLRLLPALRHLHNLQVRPGALRACLAPTSAARRAGAPRAGHW